MCELKPPGQYLKRNLSTMNSLIGFEQFRNHDLQLFHKGFHGALFSSKPRNIVTAGDPDPCFFVPFSSDKQWFLRHLQSISLENYKIPSRRSQ